jgi:inosose dehydratase
VAEVANYLRLQGIRPAYHHHTGTVMETEAETDRLMAATGEAGGLLLDTGHLTFTDGGRVARRYTVRLVRVHCKDVRPAVLAALPGDASTSTP